LQDFSRKSSILFNIKEIKIIKLEVGFNYCTVAGSKDKKLYAVKFLVHKGRNEDESKKLLEIVEREFHFNLNVKHKNFTSCFGAFTDIAYNDNKGKTNVCTCLVIIYIYF